MNIDRNEQPGVSLKPAECDCHVTSLAGWFVCLWGWEALLWRYWSGGSPLKPDKVWLQMWMTQKSSMGSLCFPSTLVSTTWHCASLSRCSYFLRLDRSSPGSRDGVLEEGHLFVTATQNLNNYTETIAILSDHGLRIQIWVTPNSMFQHGSSFTKLVFQNKESYKSWPF